MDQWLLHVQQEEQEEIGNLTEVRRCRISGTAEVKYKYEYLEWLRFTSVWTIYIDILFVDSGREDDEDDDGEIDEGKGREDDEERQRLLEFTDSQVDF